MDPNTSDRLAKIRRMVIAAHHGDMAALKAGLADGLQPSLTAWVFGADAMTPLQAAATGGHTDVIAFLVEEIGVDVDYTAFQSPTALQRAARAGHTDAVRLLIDAEANPNAVDKDGRSALHLAATQGHTPAIQLLLAGW